jgi:DNA helicase-2/ATP-dependent DNA helicase PcrA
MTLHMAKGLEFPFVFIAGLEEGLLPLLRESGPKDGFEEHDEKEEDRRLEEERRLFYVGLTRAQERVWLLRAAWRMRYGRSEPGVPSRFLDEIPEKLLETENRARAVSALLPERRAWRNEWSQEPWPRREGRGGRFHRRRRGW